MNKKILTIALALVLPISIANAATDDPGKEWHHGEKIERLTKELDLSADQKTKLETIFKGQHEKFQALHEEMKSLIAGVLTKEQMAKWEVLKQQRHEHGPRHHGDGNDGQTPPPPM